MHSGIGLSEAGGSLGHISVFDTKKSDFATENHEQRFCQKMVRDMKVCINNLGERVEKYEMIIEKQSEFMKMLAYRSIESETRSRRKNIIIWGVSEKLKYQTDKLVLDFLEDEMSIDTTDIVIEKAYRLGSISRTDDIRNKKRPIVVSFIKYSDTEHVMKKAYMLKGSPFGIDRDYPREIAEARKILYDSTEAKRARKANEKVHIKYPAQLIVNGILLSDMFPNWHSYLNRSRTVYHDNDTFVGNQREANANRIQRGTNSWYSSVHESDEDETEEINRYASALREQVKSPCNTDRIQQQTIVHEHQRREYPLSNMKTTSQRLETYKVDSPVGAISKISYPESYKTQLINPINSNAQYNDNNHKCNETCVDTLYESDNRRITRSWSKGQNRCKYKTMEIPYYTTRGESVHIASHDCDTQL